MVTVPGVVRGVVRGLWLAGERENPLTRAVDALKWNLMCPTESWHRLTAAAPSCDR